MSSAGGCPSWQAMASVRTSIVPPWPCPPLTDTPGTSPVVTTSQVTASIHDFAGSLAARSLARRKNVIALNDHEWREALKGGLVGVLRDDLQASISSPEARRRGVVLLRAVAFARSIGLPWSDVWPRVANAVDIGGSTASMYGDDAVESLLGSRLSGYL